MHIYSPSGKKYAYFSLIDLKHTKLQKKRLNGGKEATPLYNKRPNVSTARLKRDLQL